LIVKITDVIFDLIYKAPDFIRHMAITMDPETRTAVIEVILKEEDHRKENNGQYQ